MDTLRCSWHELRRRRVRTLMSILGYTLAVGLMVVIVTALINSRQATGRILNHTGTHFVAFIPMDRSMCLPCLAQWSRTRTAEGFTAFGIATSVIPRDFIGKVNELETVAKAAPYLQYRFRDPNSKHLFTVGGFNSSDEKVVGTTCCAAADIIEGRFLTAHDKGRVMLEQAYATFLQVKVDQDITISDQTFRVAGIVNPGIRPAKADVYMLYEDARRLVNGYMGDLVVEDPINVILVEVARANVQDKAIRQIKRLWPDLVVSSYGCYKPASRVLAINRAMAAGLVIVVAVSVVLLSARSQMASLIERRREIGILKAIGWDNSCIVKQILTESLIQALAGACCGSLLAIGVLYLMRMGLINSINIASSIDLLPSVFLMGFVLAIAGGLIAGSVPALIVACQWPASLLRRI